MIKFKSKKLVPKYDVYNRLLGEFTQRMIINEIIRKGDEITPTGFYYYINEGQEVVDAPIKNTTFKKEEVSQAEAQLPPFTSSNIFDAIDERIVQFAFIKWQLENGSSFGLLAEDWEIDVE